VLLVVVAADAAGADIRVLVVLAAVVLHRVLIFFGEHVVLVHEDRTVPSRRCRVFACSGLSLVSVFAVCFAYVAHFDWELKKLDIAVCLES